MSNGIEYPTALEEALRARHTHSLRRLRRALLFRDLAVTWAVAYTVFNAGTLFGLSWSGFLVLAVASAVTTSAAMRRNTSRRLAQSAAAG